MQRKAYEYSEKSLFLWDDRFQTEENQGIILSGAYKISYIQSQSRLTVRKNTDYLESFWGRIHMGPCIGLLCHCR